MSPNSLSTSTSAGATELTAAKTVTANRRASVNAARQRATCGEAADSQSPLKRPTLRRSSSSGTASTSTKKRPGVRRSKTAIGSSRSTSNKPSLLHDYTQCHADVSSQSPIARRKVSVDHEPVVTSQYSPTGFDLPARKYPKEKPKPGAASVLDLSLSLLSDASESASASERTIDNSGQSAEELIQFRVRNPNSVAAQTPTVPKPAPMLSQNQLMMARNHKALHSIEESEEDKIGQSSATNLLSMTSDHTTSYSTAAAAPISSTSTPTAAPTPTAAAPTTISEEEQPLPVGEKIDTGAQANMMDVSTNSFAGNVIVTPANTEAPGASATDTGATLRVSEVSTFSEVTTATSRISEVSTLSEHAKRFSDISTLTTVSDQSDNHTQRTSTTPTTASVPNSLSTTSATTVTKPSSRISSADTDLPPLEPLPTQSGHSVRTSSALTPPHSPRRTTSNSMSPNKNKSVRGRNGQHPNARLLQAAKNAVKDDVPSRRSTSSRRQRRNTADNTTALPMPGLRRTQTADSHTLPKQQHSRNIDTKSMDGSGRMDNGSGRIPSINRRRRSTTSDGQEDDSSRDSIIDGMDNSAPVIGSRNRGVRRSKSSDGASVGFGRMRRAGRRDGGTSTSACSDDPMGGESFRRTPTRSRSSDGGMMAVSMNHHHSRGRFGGRRSTNNIDDNPVTSSSQRKNNSFRRSKSNVGGNQEALGANTRTRSLSPTNARRSTSSTRDHHHNKDSSFGANHPSRFNSSRIKRWDKDDITAGGFASSSSFGGAQHELQKLMAQSSTISSGGLYSH